MAIGKSVRKDHLLQKKVVPTHSIINGKGCVISKNTVCTVIDVVQGRGLTIETSKCPECGQYTRITGVKREELDFYDPEKHGTPFLPKDVYKLLDNVSFMLNKQYDYEFVQMKTAQSEYASPNEWLEKESKFHAVLENQYEKYEDKLEAFELYKRIEAMLGR